MYGELLSSVLVSHFEQEESQWKRRRLQGCLGKGKVMLKGNDTALHKLVMSLEGKTEVTPHGDLQHPSKGQ